MAATQASASYGATVTIDGIDIAEVGDIAGLPLSTDMEEVTHHGSPDGAEERVPTIKRLGDLTFPINVVVADPGQQDLYAAWAGRTAVDIVATMVSGLIQSFTGYVTGFQPAAAVAGHDSADITITPKSAPTVTYGS